MKLTFFLIAFILVFLRVYLSCTGVMHGGRSNVEGTMTVISDNYREEIRWSGVIRFDSEETTIVSITPGGYFKYRLNDKKLVAESNLQGEISYELYDDGEKTALDSNGRKFIAKAVKELIAAGFDAKERIERIYQKGGNIALLNEVGKQKTGPLNTMYMERVFANDSMPDEYLPLVLQKIGSLGTDNDKMNFLRKINLSKLEDPQIKEAFFEIVAKLGVDNNKADMMKHVMDQGPISGDIFDRIEGISRKLGTDNDKVDMYKKLLEEKDITEEQRTAILQDASKLGIDNDKVDMMKYVMDKGPISDKIFDKIEGISRQLGTDNDKVDMYKRLIEEKNITEEQWMAIIKDASQLGTDNDKSDLLVHIAPKMPAGENIKAAYLEAAKKISSDMDYGKVMRAVN